MSPGAGPMMRSRIVQIDTIAGASAQIVHLDDAQFALLRQSLAGIMVLLAAVVFLLIVIAARQRSTRDDDA